MDVTVGGYVSITLCPASRLDVMYTVDCVFQASCHSTQVQYMESQQNVRCMVTFWNTLSTACDITSNLNAGQRVIETYPPTVTSIWLIYHKSLYLFVCLYYFVFVLWFVCFFAIFVVWKNKQTFIFVFSYTSHIS